jgi:hypothetical protein
MHIRDMQICFFQGVVQASRRTTEMNRINGESHCVISLYRLSVGSPGTAPKIRSVSVALTEENCDPFRAWAAQGPKEYYIDWHVVIPPRHFDRSDFERKRWMLDLTHEILTAMAVRAGWPLEPLQVAYDECLRRNLTNEFYWPFDRRVQSPDRTRYARIQWHFGFEQIDLDLVVETRDGTEVFRRLLTTIPADEWSLFDALHRLAWISPTTVKLSSRHGSPSWRMKVP